MTSQRIEISLSFLRECEQQSHIAAAEECDAGNETQDILHSLERLLGDVRRAEKRLENRAYVPRKKG